MSAVPLLEATVAGCLQERDGKGADSDTKPGHLIPVCFDERVITSPGNRSTVGPNAPSPTLNQAGQMTVAAVDVAHCLRAGGHDASEDGTGRGVPIIPVAFQTRIARNGRGQPKDVVDALTSCDGGTHADSKPHVAFAGGVRRLTPRECERLQGFPDDWTAGFADSPRYKMLGNAVAVPVARWIARRIIGGGVVYAHELPLCDCCDEPWCPRHQKHYADCDCIGPNSEF